MIVGGRGLKIQGRVLAAHPLDEGLASLGGPAKVVGAEGGGRLLASVETRPPVMRPGAR